MEWTSKEFLSVLRAFKVCESEGIGPRGISEIEAKIRAELEARGVPVEKCAERGHIIYEREKIVRKCELVFCSAECADHYFAD